MATDRTKFLNDFRADLEKELQDIEAAKAAQIADADKADKKTIIPILEQLVDEALDAELRGDWLVRLKQYRELVNGWDDNIRSWDTKIAELQDKIADIDRLLGV